MQEIKEKYHTVSAGGKQLEHGVLERRIIYYMQYFNCFKQENNSDRVGVSPLYINRLLQGSLLLQMLYFLVILHQQVHVLPSNPPTDNIKVPKHGTNIELQ
jgi:hypothetical protein